MGDSPSSVPVSQSPPPADPAAERVLVVPRAAFDGLGGVAGFIPAAPDHPILAGLLALPATFRPRGEVESDEAWLQPIPYVVLRHGGRVFAYDRGKDGGEARLHGRWSVGIGGHVNDGDARTYQGRHLPPTVDDVMLHGVCREVEEEMGYLPGEIDNFLAPLGLILDPSDAVGRVHLGIAYTLDLDRPPLVPISATGYAMVEPEVEVDLSHSWGHSGLPFMERYESWSRLILAHLAAAAAEGGGA